MTTLERRPDSRGKVRDIYQAGDNLLMVATDRISAYDFILPDEIPFKGEVLNRISAFWFDKFADLVPNHLVSIDVDDFPAEFAEYRDYLAGRAMLVVHRPRLPHRFGQEDLRCRRHRLRHQASCRPHRGVQAPRPYFHPVHQGRHRRP